MHMVIDKLTHVLVNVEVEWINVRLYRLYLSQFFLITLQVYYFNHIPCDRCFVYIILLHYVRSNYISLYTILYVNSIASNLLFLHA